MAQIKKPLAAALGAAFLATSIAPMVSAEANPFSAQQLSGGYDLASYGKAEGEGGCSGKKDAEGGCSGKKDAEGGCSGKAGAEGGCSGKKDAEGGCSGKAGGEGSCSGKAEGDSKAMKSGGCGAGKCSGNK